VYIVPLESDMYRCTPEGKMRVYRTTDGGKSWHALANGLPQKNAFETVLRDGMGVDALNPAGVYVGTRSGKVYASGDGGASWVQVADGLPPVVCVRAGVIGDPAKIRVPHAKGARTARKPAKASTKRTKASAARKPAKAAARRKPVAKAAARRKPTPRKARSR
jgi:hypothetical protein